MSGVLRIAGNVLIAASVLGLICLGVLMVVPDGAAEPTPASATAPTHAASARTARAPQAPVNAPFGFAALSGLFGGRDSASLRGAAQASRQTTPSADIASANLDTAAIRPITRIEIPSIELDAEVVPADLVTVEGGYTWQVPAFKVGHAESTAGAGQAGNAVLLGHVTSLHSGNVFQDLDQVQVSDAISVYSETDKFEYHVVSITHVPRSDSSVLDTTQTASISLITCTGFWLPTIWDYTERLVVRAELSG